MFAITLEEPHLGESLREVPEGTVQRKVEKQRSKRVAVAHTQRRWLAVGVAEIAKDGEEAIESRSMNSIKTVCKINKLNAIKDSRGVRALVLIYNKYYDQLNTDCYFRLLIK